MSSRRNKLYYILFKTLGIIVSCAMPILAICEKFPIWRCTYGTSRSLGVGGILILMVALIVLRKTVFKFVEDKLKLKHAPPLVIWIVMLIVSYILIYLGSFLRDLNVVLWMGVIGCAIGSVMTFIAENRFGNKKEGKSNE